MPCPIEIRLFGVRHNPYSANNGKFHPTGQKNSSFEKEEFREGFRYGLSRFDPFIWRKTQPAFRG